MDKSFKSNRSLTSYAGLWAKGVCMGAADVVPGVSGGTMAFILGIYQELIGSIRSVDTQFLRLVLTGRFREAAARINLWFLVSVGAGIGTAIISLARLLSWLLENQPVYLWSFFFGLIIASVISVSKRLEKWTPSAFLWAGAGAAFTYFLVGIVPANTPDAAWFLILSGAICICAMILPGISGAFILVLLGKYKFVLDAVHGFTGSLKDALVLLKHGQFTDGLAAISVHDFLTVFFVGIGAIIGILSFVRLLNYLFTKHHDLIIALLTGFMVGSLRKVWPWKEPLEHSTREINKLPDGMGGELFIAIILAVTGIIAVLLLDYLAAEKDENKETDKGLKNGNS